MIAAAGIPENARCRKCGYALRGLPGFVCPECGRRFDPADARTFDTAPPGWRRKRWIKRAAITAVVLIVLFAAFPRGLMDSNISFTCADCGHARRVRRLEIRPPDWVPFRYPSLTWTDAQEGRAPHVAEFHRNYRTDVRSDLFCGGTVTGRADCTTSSPCEVNGILVTRDSASLVLREMLSPANLGIQIGGGR